MNSNPTSWPAPEQEQAATKPGSKGELLVLDEHPGANEDILPPQKKESTQAAPAMKNTSDPASSKNLE